ncbi:coiled-coil domain-containing protein 110-like [Haliotis cracherodii]|uniref:coiled-coil domain-containing protein 110-like n=1 Tax=Haliotis cracherodii TaxID=6455 RepID=UPI0039EB997B
MGVVVSSPVHPSENVLVDLDVALGKDQTIEDNRKETIGVLRRLPKLKNVTERDVVDTCVLLQEAKEKKVQVAQGTGSIPNRLTQKEIDDQIRIYNTERLCVVIDHGIRRLYEDDSWITGLTSGKIKNVEVGTHELNFAQEYMDEFRKKRTEKQDQEKTKDLANIFCRRLDIQEIQDAINHVNKYQSVVRVMRSATSKELMASMKIKYFDLNELVKGKKERTFVAYHKLLTQSKDEGEKRAVYVKVAGNDNVTDEDIKQCLKEIKRIIAHHAAILKINQVISIRKADTKNIMSALQLQDAELELPSEETDEDSDREREYQILLYEAYTDKAVGKADIRMERDDIQRVLLSRDILKKIDLLKDDQKDDTCFLLESLRKDEMNICEYLEDEMDESDEWSLASLIFCERDNKKTGTTDENSCKLLTRQEIKRIVKEFKAVWDIQKGNPQELQKHWDTVLRDANVLPDGTKSQKEAEFEKLEGYRKLFKGEVEHQQGEKAKRGFENLLRRKDVQRIMFESQFRSIGQMYPAIISINKVIELFIDAKTQGKNEQQDKDKDRQRKKVIDDLEKKCLRAIREKSANLVDRILVDNKNKGFLTVLSGKREGNKQEFQVAEDKCFKERLTWKQMRETLSGKYICC